MGGVRIPCLRADTRRHVHLQARETTQPGAVHQEEASPLLADDARGKVILSKEGTVSHRKLKHAIGFTFVLVSVFSFLFVCSATETRLYFSSDQLGQNPVVQIQEGDVVWIVVVDNDENLDEFVRDRFYANVTILDSHTGAILDPTAFPSPGLDPTVGHVAQTPENIFMIESEANSGLFVSNHAIQIGQRKGWNEPTEGYHIAGPLFTAAQGHHHAYFENMDTILGMYQDWNDDSDTAIAMMKIIDTRASIVWSSDVFDDPSESASITIVDPDENLNRSKVEAIPVFVLVNPDSWNTISPDNATALQAFLTSTSVDGVTGLFLPEASQISPQSIYNAEANLRGARGAADGRYYAQYPDSADTNSPHGIVPVSFWAIETGVDTGVFVLTLDNISLDLGFLELSSGDTIAAFYIDPNNFGDFTLATTSVLERPRTLSRFIDALRASFAKSEAIKTQVFDGETTAMYFLDRQGNRLSEYVTSDCIFIEVLDPDQNIDPNKRERIDAYAASATAHELRPQSLNPFSCDVLRLLQHSEHRLLGDTNLFGDGTAPLIFVLNPRNGRWASFDLLETGDSTGRFVSVICLDISSVYECVPSLDARPGDTLLACYQDPSNPSDVAWISIRIDIGGGAPH